MVENKRLMIIASVLTVAALAGGFWLGEHLRGGSEANRGAPVPSGIPTATEFAAQVAAPKIGQPRPEFKLLDSEGEWREAKEWDGKLLVVNFWATWCPPCLEEIPVFIRLQDKYAEKQVQFLGIALDRAQAVRRFVEDSGMNYPTLRGEQDAIEVAKAFGNQLGALPFTAVVSRDGKIVSTYAGELLEEDAESMILAALAKEAAR